MAAMAQDSSLGTPRLVTMLFFAFAYTGRDCSAFQTLCPSRKALHLFLSQENNDKQQREDMLEKALRLRQEASELEASLSSSRSQRQSASASSPSKPAPVYTDMAGSVWSFSYRFSDQPDDDDTGLSPKRTFYSGKLTLALRPDGYTDIVSHEPGASGKQLTVSKAWGWDVERSQEDEKEYLLFSVDASVPSQDEPEKQRFYFQARKETEGAGLSLKGGTVTIKQDVFKSNASRWSLFSPSGILAEFRYVGDFVSKAQ